MVFGFIAIVVFIGLAAAGIVWYLKYAYARYAQAWSALTPIVAGAAKGAKMTGSYHGLPVEARINSVSDSENRHTRYYFELKLTGRPGGRDWKIVYGGEKLLGFGEKRWHVSTKDDALRERLTSAGAVAEMQDWGGQPTVSYKAKSGRLEYSEQVGGMYALPSPERFTAQLELLRRFAQFNEQANAA